MYLKFQTLIRIFLLNMRMDPEYPYFSFCGIYKNRQKHIWEDIHKWSPTESEKQYTQRKWSWKKKKTYNSLYYNIKKKRNTMRNLALTWVPLDISNAQMWYNVFPRDGHWASLRMERWESFETRTWKGGTYLKEQISAKCWLEIMDLFGRISNQHKGNQRK